MLLLTLAPSVLQKIHFRKKKATYIDRNLSHQTVALDNYFTAQRCHGNLDQVLPGILVDGEGFADALQVGQCGGSGHFKAVRYTDRVDTLVEEVGCLFQ